MDETLDLILTVWFKGSPSKKGRKRFTAIEASKMAGKLACLAEGAPWVCFLISQLYTSIAYALAQNKPTVERSSLEFQELLKLIKNRHFKATSNINREHGNIIRFALKKAARMYHHAPIEYNIVPSMREELNFFENFLKPDSGVAWETPIAF